MNKLKEILDQFEFDWGYFKLRCHKYLPNGEKLSAGWITEKDVKKYIQMACIDYARSFEYLSFSINEGVTDYNNGYNDCIKDILHRIDQDLQSLNLPQHD